MLTDYPDIMTIREAMEVLGISRNTIYEYIRSGTIPAFKLGTKIWRIKKSDLITYVNNQ